MVGEAGIGSHAATLGRLLDFFEAIARRSAYLSLLTEYPHTLERVIRMINASGWAATFLTGHPILLDELARGAQRRVRARVGRRDDELDLASCNLVADLLCGNLNAANAVLAA